MTDPRDAELTAEIFEAKDKADLLNRRCLNGDCGGCQWKPCAAVEADEEVRRLEALAARRAVERMGEGRAAPNDPAVVRVMTEAVPPTPPNAEGLREACPTCDDVRWVVAPNANITGAVVWNGCPRCNSLAAQSSAGTGETEPAEPTGDCVTVLGVAGPGLQQRSGAPLSAVRAPTTTRTGEAADDVRAGGLVQPLPMPPYAFQRDPSLTESTGQVALVPASTPALTGAGIGVEPALSALHFAWTGFKTAIQLGDQHIIDTDREEVDQAVLAIIAAARAAEAASGKTEGGA